MDITPKNYGFVEIKSFFGIPARGGGSPGQNFVILTEFFGNMASPPRAAEALRRS
jgi:hypothetical protein